MGLVELRQLYRAVMLPQISYGCSVWYAPQKDGRQPQKMRSEMTKIQLHTARVISGAYRATSSPDAPLAVYSDGSGIHGKIGAAAVTPSLSVHDQAYLGKETVAFVYAAELIGILMAVNIAI
jgi:hypothetical protein